MSRLHHFVLLTLAAISCMGLSTPANADEPRLEKDWFVGPWDVDYQALVLLPNEAKLKTDRGTEFSEYVLSFEAQARFVVEKDRVVMRSKTAGPTAKYEPINDKGGQVILEQRHARFFHRAHWKTADGAASDYAFTATGVLQGSGQFAAKALELNLEWTTLDGQGTSGGRRIAKPVGVHTWKSKWALKPETPAKSDLAGVTTPKLVLAATRTTPMPQQLAGCPPLPLLERVSIVRSPIADLEVKAKDAPDPVPASKARTLSVTVKNLGPDDSLGTVLRVVLAEDAKFLSAGEARPLKAEGDILTFNLDKVANGASVKFDIRLEYEAAKTSEAKAAAPTTLIHVSGAGYDPNQANNGHFERAKEEIPSR